MERWLTKPRVLACLCVVLLSASLNHKSPLVYGLFLFLVVLFLLAYLIPWLSLRGMSLQVGRSIDLTTTERERVSLDIQLHRRYRWPAFMVDIETVWDWESLRVVDAQTLPMVLKGTTPWIKDGFKFPCRGHYRLKSVALSSGFPLGFARARLELKCPEIQVQVLPEPHPVSWPTPWAVSEDPSGELVTPRLGNSLELSMLQHYVPGERVGRINWRASARTGELIIQHFHQTGSIRLHVVIVSSDLPERGDSDSSCEQGIRLTAGICQSALRDGAKLLFYGHAKSEPMREWPMILSGLAGFLPKHQPLSDAIIRVVEDGRAGEQLAVVVSHHASANWLIGQLWPVLELPMHIVVWIALPRQFKPQDSEQASRLQRTLQQNAIVAIVSPTDE